MCRGSVYAKDTEEAVQGVNYDISSTTHFGGNYLHGTLHRQGQGPVDDPSLQIGERVVACAACIRDDLVQVQLSGIPIDLQKRFAIDSDLQAFFCSGDNQPDHQDKLELADGRQLYLYEFADVGVKLCLAPVAVEQHVETIKTPARVLEDA